MFLERTLYNKQLAIGPKHKEDKMPIVDILEGVDIRDTNCGHIVFAIETGHAVDANLYDSDKLIRMDEIGFPLLIAETVWPQLKNWAYFSTFEGQVMSKEISGICYHAIFCFHNTYRSDHNAINHGWLKTPELLRECLEKLPIEKNVSIALRLMGSWRDDEKWKPGITEIIDVISESPRPIYLYKTHYHYHKIRNDTGELQRIEMWIK